MSAVLTLGNGVEVRAAEPVQSAELEVVVSDMVEVSEESGPVEPVPMEDVGFYPTIEEALLLGGDYARRGNSNYEGPDSRQLTASGIHLYPNPGESYRAPWGDSLSPLNPFLGFFAPRQAVVVEDANLWPRGTSFQMDASFPLLMRDFSPERAMLKAGPAYFDLMFIGMTVLHSDYQGEQAFADGAEDGWLMGVEFGIRGVVQFTDRFYLSLAATLVYLPLENEVGFRLGGGGAPTTALTLDYRFEKGDWDVRLYDTFYAGFGIDVFADAGEEAYDQAGRYSFGFGDPRRRTGDFYDEDGTYFTNSIGFDSTNPVGEDWRFWLSGEHADTWRTFDFDDHRSHNSIFARIGYNGYDVAFSPALEYHLDHYPSWGDGDSRLDQRVYLTIRGRITENLRLESRAGYLWSSGDATYDDGYLYSIGLHHELSSYTSHSLMAGRDYYTYDLTGDSVVSSYVRYSINQEFTNALSASLWYQYSEEDGSRFDGKRTNLTGSLRYALSSGNASAIQLRVAYENRDGSTDNVSGDRWIGRLTYTQNLFSRTWGETYYQYEESSISPDFNEQVFGTTIRRYF